MAGREDYEERKQARIDRLENAAEKARTEAAAKYKKSDELVKDIPFGQPNIAGRSALPRLRERSWNALGKAIECNKKAEYYDECAKTAVNNDMISSDDPNCIEKLHEKINKLTEEKEFYKAVNAYFKKHGTCKGFEGVSEEQAANIDGRIEKYHLFEEMPFASFELTSLNQRIKAAKDRIEKIKKVEAMPNEKIVYDGLCEIESNTEINRVSIKFNEQQPKYIIDLLLRNGYKWSYTEKQWQRLRTPSAWHCTKMLIEQIQKMVNENGINN